MIRYLVKKTMRATENNKNFPGVWHEVVFGKCSERLKWDSNEIHVYKFDFINDITVRLKGYTREDLARRSWEFRHLQNDDRWRTDVEIIKYEIAE